MVEQEKDKIQGTPCKVIRNSKPTTDRVQDYLDDIDTNIFVNSKDTHERS